jgi:hypothetical protein
VAFALFTSFTETGPPSILQTDNGSEFSNHAHDHVGRRLVLEDEFIDLVIIELKNLWGPWLTKTLRVQRRCGKSESDCSEEIGWLDENE